MFRAELQLCFISQYNSSLLLKSAKLHTEKGMFLHVDIINTCTFMHNMWIGKLSNKKHEMCLQQAVKLNSIVFLPLESGFLFTCPHTTQIP